MPISKRYRVSPCHPPDLPMLRKRPSPHSKTSLPLEASLFDLILRHSFVPPNLPSSPGAASAGGSSLAPASPDPSRGP